MMASSRARHLKINHRLYGRYFWLRKVWMTAYHLEYCLQKISLRAASFNHGCEQSDHYSSQIASADQLVVY